MCFIRTLVETHNTTTIDLHRKCVRCVYEWGGERAYVRMCVLCLKRCVNFTRGLFGAAKSKREQKHTHTHRCIGSRMDVLGKCFPTNVCGLAKYINRGKRRGGEGEGQFRLSKTQIAIITPIHKILSKQTRRNTYKARHNPTTKPTASVCVIRKKRNEWASRILQSILFTHKKNNCLQTQKRTTWWSWGCVVVWGRSMCSSDVV